MSTQQQIDEFNLFFTGMRSDCLRKAYTKYQSEIIKKELQERKYEGTMLQEVYDKAMAYRRSEIKDQYYFITICPYEDINILNFQKVMDKVMKKKWMNKYVYVYEQRQDQTDKPYSGIHTHIIVKRETIAKSDVIREIFNTCKSIVGSKQSIDVKLITTQHDLDVKLNYILGKKATQEKQQKQIIDKIFRDQNNLQSYYFKDWEQSDLTRFVIS